MASGADVIAVGTALVGKGAVYASAPHAPTTFDCSLFTQWCYQNGAQVNIGRDTNAQIAFSGGQTIWDVLGQGTLGPPAESALLPGDLIFWGKVGDGGPNAHVQMYMGSSQIIEAHGPSGTAVPTTTSLDLTGGNVGGLPLRAIRRYLTATAIIPGATSVGGQTAVNPAGLVDPTFQNYQDSAKKDLPDPRNNLPFSAQFLSTPTLQIGSTAPLIRGGISELNIYGNRPRGQFAFYFMMNPAEIDQSYVFDQNIPIPQTVSVDAQALASYPMQNQSWNFTIFLNRMYEVYQGGFAGPSDIGVRWDIRALERLMGLYDDVSAQVDTAPGISLYASGGKTAPIGLPVQVVFGGLNSLRFQAIMQEVSVQYTRFDRNMVPVEAVVTIGMIKVYIPPKGLDLVNALVRAYATSGGTVPVPSPPYFGPRLGLKGPQ
jgi:hypothetical protein